MYLYMCLYIYIYIYGGEISITTTLVFILNYSQEKLMTKFFKKFRKLNFRVFWGLFCPHLGKNKFSWKRGYHFSVYVYDVTMKELNDNIDHKNGYYLN